MNGYHTPIGSVSVGDVVEFSHPTGTKIGKVSSIDGTIFKIYCTDKNGGMTITVPIYNILKKIPTLKHEEVVTTEEIKKPARYNKKGKLECWDVILDQEMNFLEGSILKYLWRYKEKNGIHDLEKAKVYIDKIIEGLKK